MSEISRKLSSNYEPSELPTPDFGFYLYQDGMVPFLKLKISRRNRSWVFEKWWQQKHFKRQIGSARLISLNEARLKAYEIARMLEDGITPLTIKERGLAALKQRITVENIFVDYFEQHVKLRCRTANEIEKDFGRYWDSIRKIHISHLTTNQVRLWMNKIAKASGHATANKQFGLLRACLKWACADGAIQSPDNLLLGIKAFPCQQRITYLHPGNEVSRLAAILEKEHQDTQDIIWLLLWTGQRRNNVLSMQWVEIDWLNQIWHIPPHKTKSARQYSIALTPKAMEILERRKANGDKCVFPSLTTFSGHIIDVNRPWLRIRKAAGLEHLRLHDLRHTAASWLALQGASSMVIKEALQHQSISTSQKYVHLVASDVRTIMTRAQQAIVC